MSNKSLSSLNCSYKKPLDTIPCRIQFIKELLNGKQITPLVDFENTDTECFVGSRKGEDESGESYDTRVVLQKQVVDFCKTIMSIGGTEKQLEYIKSGTTGHTFKGTVNNSENVLEYAVKVVAYPKKEKYGSIYDIRRPENAELKMLKVLSYFVVKKQTPHLVLPIGIFDTNIKVFTKDDFIEVVGENNEKYQEFLNRYKNREYDNTVSVLISEWANRGDLLDFLRKFYNTPPFTAMHWKVIFFQLLSVLAVIQTKYPGFRHNDLKANNVLVHKIEKQAEIFTYRIARKKYRVKNIGYQIKLWDYDFACIPGVVENKKVELEWTKQINVTPKQNRYYDVHYFFNTLIKRGFVHGIMTSENVPKEVRDFINRILPKKYQNNSKAHELKKLINEKLVEKYKSLYNKHNNLHEKNSKGQAKAGENFELARKYSELYNKCEDNDYGAKYIHNYYIPSEIKSSILEIISENKGCDNGVLLGYVHEKGRLLVDDEYLTPQEILENDPYFEEFRVQEDINKNEKIGKKNEKIVKKNEKIEKNERNNNVLTNGKNNTNGKKNMDDYLEKRGSKKGAPDISVFLKNSHYDPFSSLMVDKVLDGGKKDSKKKSKRTSKKNRKKKSKSRTIDEEIKRVNIDDIFYD